MRKLATLAALALCSVGTATTASADVNIGGDLPSASTDAGTSAVDGSVGFANSWCGAPWLWAAQQTDSGCAGAQQHNPPTQQQ